jgi:hypothetical protein
MLWVGEEIAGTPIVFIPHSRIAAAFSVWAHWRASAFGVVWVDISVECHSCSLGFGDVVVVGALGSAGVRILCSDCR